MWLILYGFVMLWGSKASLHGEESWKQSAKGLKSVYITEGASLFPSFLSESTPVQILYPFSWFTLKFSGSLKTCSWCPVLMCPELMHLVTLNSTHPIAWESELKELWALWKRPFVALGFFNLGEKGERNAPRVLTAEGKGATALPRRRGQEPLSPVEEQHWLWQGLVEVPCGLVQRCRDLPLS